MFILQSRVFFSDFLLCSYRWFWIFICLHTNWYRQGKWYTHVIEFVGNWIEFIQLFCLSHLLSWFTSWLNSKKINLFLQEFRRSQEPVDRSSYTTSYYNLLKEYLNPVVKEEFPHAWEELEILENETQRYPGLTISYEHSTIFLAPKSHCDPIQYLYDDNLAKKTINAHRYMNSYETDDGCVGDQIYDKGIR